MWNSDAFEKELSALINSHSLDNMCETPDYILAEMTTGFLLNFASTMRDREKWFGRIPE